MNAFYNLGFIGFLMMKIKNMKSHKLSLLSLIFCSFLFSNSAYSQTKGGEAIYSIVLTIDEKLKENSGLAQSKEVAVRYAEHVEILLRFNEERAIHSVKDNDGILSDERKKVLNWCSDCSITYFTDLTKRIILFNNKEISMGLAKKDEFLIEGPLPSDWVLSNETKVINDLKCYKATRNSSRTFRGKVHTRDIVAWYAPDIPYSFGPNGQGGLPGLIIELQEGSTLFGLKNLKLTGTSPIDLPTKGKKITKEAYDTILEERTNSLIDAMKGR